jgi:hypothetical protein
MPATLHEELARASERDGVSLNQFITGVLAGAVGWKREDGSNPVPAAGGTSARPRSLSVLLVANLVLVAAAAIAAIVFLIAAWLS